MFEISQTSLQAASPVSLRWGLMVLWVVRTKEPKSWQFLHSHLGPSVLSLSSLFCDPGRAADPAGWVQVQN